MQPSERPSTILIIDDEEMVRSVTRRALSRVGHTVIEASEGEQALAILEDGETDVDLILLDMIMPGMDGLAFHREMKARGYEVPTLIHSGFAIENAIQTVLDEGAIGFIQKPYDLHDLINAVEEALKQNGGEGRKIWYKPAKAD